jgi:hypothetical protein
MTKRRVMLTFSLDIVSEPIIYNLGQQFNLITNIRQADVTEDKGWVVLELDGKEEDIEAGTTWAISRGVRVEPISDDRTDI